MFQLSLWIRITRVRRSETSTEQNRQVETLRANGTQGVVDDSHLCSAESSCGQRPEGRLSRNTAASVEVNFNWEKTFSLWNLKNVKRQIKSIKSRSQTSSSARACHPLKSAANFCSFSTQLNCCREEERKSQAEKIISTFNPVQFHIEFKFILKIKYSLSWELYGCEYTHKFSETQQQKFFNPQRLSANIDSIILDSNWE